MRDETGRIPTPGFAGSPVRGKLVSSENEFVLDSHDEGESVLSQSAVVQLPVVLVIDDSPDVQRLVSRALEDGAEVLQEYGAPEPGGLDFEDFDLVILDYQMPVRDGFEVLKEIREQSDDLPVLFLTGFGEPEIAQKAMELGATRFLTKPVQPSHLQQVFLELTDKRSAKGRSSEGDRGSMPARAVVPVADRSRSFRALDEGGKFVSGEVVRFSSRVAVVEFSNEVGIQKGGRLAEISFMFGRQLVSAVDGVIASFSKTSKASLEALVVITDIWGVEEQAEKSIEEEAPRNNDVAVPKLLEGASLRSRLPDHFRLSVHELAAFLGEIHKEAISFSGSLDREGRLERLKAESAYAVNMGSAFYDAFWKVMSAFERSAASVVEDGQLEDAKALSRSELFPTVLASPFLSRIVERPIGVPGDFGMLGQILGNPLEGYSLFDRILNGWILQSGAANAYRHRVWLLEREIRDCVRRCNAEGRPARILSMASGVAYEVQAYHQNPEPGAKVEFTMVDFSEETLEEARRQFGILGKTPDDVVIEMHQSSVIELANRARGLEPEGEIQFDPGNDYDLVYCAGLFDYLSDRLIRRVVSYLYSTLQAEGRLVVSNYTFDNPLRGLMTVVLDWELIYRSSSDFEGLIRAALPEADVSIELDEDKAEVYGLVKKDNSNIFHKN